MVAVNTDNIAVMCKNVTKTFGSGATAVQALRGVNLEVRKGELLMLVGPSGCGKTTLISVIAGILERTGGDCRVFAQDLQAMHQYERTHYRGEHIGFVFQSFNLLPTLSTQENVAVPLLILGRKRKESLSLAARKLEEMGFDKRMMEARPSQLSGGQQQRVALARAIVHDPQLVVCDEPTSALDHQTGHRVMELLRQVALRDGRALIVVTHDARIFEFADRMVHMDDGHVVDIKTNNRGNKP